MARKKNGNSTPASDGAVPLVTSDEDKSKARKWFDRARDLGNKRQFDYAIEYYISGLEFWPDAVEDACKPLHGCAVARRQTGGKKPGLRDTMGRSMNDKDAKKALSNALWLFGHDPENTGFIEGITRSANRLGADDATKWAAGVTLKSLESAPKASAKQFQALVQLLEDSGDRAAERDHATFGVEVYQMALEALNLWRRRFPNDQNAENAVKNLSTKLTILKGKYQKDGSFRDSMQDSGHQMDLHDQKRSVQSDDRLSQLIAQAETTYKENPDKPEALKALVDLLCRREQDEGETRAIGLLVAQYKRSDDYRWKQLADDIRMKQFSRKGRALAAAGDRDKMKEHRIAQLRFELSVFKERVAKYPTDNRMKFGYGVRNFQAGRFDDAIPLFQTARSDAKNRTACGMYLGRCFFRKGYHDQAIAALQEASEQHEIDDDDLAKTMLYWLGRAQTAGGDVGGARKTFGKLLQLDYNFSDVRARLDGLPQNG